MRKWLMLLGVLLAAPAYAEPIPRENVAQIFNECVATGPRTDTHRQYCRCYASQMGDKISLQLALTLSGEIQAQRARGGIPLDQLRVKHPEIWNIGQECRVSTGMPRLP